MNTINSQCILVTGAARSGKSEWAERLALNYEKQGMPVIYVATSEAHPEDAEWQTRIQLHRQRRPSTWNCIEGPVALADTIARADAQTCLLVDSLGTWLASLLDQQEPEWEKTRQALLESLKETASTVIFVAEEVGWGVVPAYPVGRVFRDRLGQLTRNVGAIANPVYLVTGGHVLNLSELGIPLPRSSSSEGTL